MIKNRKGFIVLMIAFVVISGAIITLVSTKIEENTKQKRNISEVKNNGSNVKVYKNSELNFEIDYSDSFDPKEGEKDFFGDAYDYNLVLNKYDFSDLYLTVFLNMFIRTDKDSIETCNKSYVRTGKYVGEETGDDVSDYKLPKTQNINGETFYSEWDYEGDMMGTYEQISYKKLYNNKCYQLAISLFHSSYPAKSDVIKDKAKYDKILKDRKEKGEELVKEFEEVIKGFRFTEKKAGDLFSAVKSGNFSETKLLIERGADVNATDGEITPLIIAAREGFLDISLLLLRSGADANFIAKDYLGGTAIVEASRNGNTVVVQELLKIKNLIMIDEALFWASKNGHVDIIKILATAGANINSVNGQFGNTPLLIAYDNLQIVKELILLGVDVNKKNYSGETALMYAVDDGNSVIVSELIKAGADVNIKDKYSRTVLMLASSSGNIEVVKELIKAGADVNARDVDGVTALIEGNKNPEVVKELIKAGAR